MMEILPYMFNVPLPSKIKDKSIYTANHFNDSRKLFVLYYIILFLVRVTCPKGLQKKMIFAGLHSSLTTNTEDFSYFVTSANHYMK